MPRLSSSLANEIAVNLVLDTFHSDYIYMDVLSSAWADGKFLGIFSGQPNNEYDTFFRLSGGR